MYQIGLRKLADHEEFLFDKAAGCRMQHHMVRAYSNNGSEKGRIFHQSNRAYSGRIRFIRYLWYYSAVLGRAFSKSCTYFGGGAMRSPHRQPRPNLCCRLAFRCDDALTHRVSFLIVEIGFTAVKLRSERKKVFGFQLGARIEKFPKD